MLEINATLFPLGPADTKPRIRYLHIDVTVRCNLRCVYCYYSDFNNAGSQAEEVEESRLIEVIDEAAELGCQRVILSGGEAFMTPRIWPIVEHCASRKIEMSFITNGVLLQERIVSRLAEYRHLIHEVKVSYDGPNNDIMRGAGTGKKALHAIELLSKSLVPWTVNTIVSKHNVNDLEAIYRWISNLTPKSWRVDHVFHEGSGRSRKREFQEFDWEYFFIVLQKILEVYLAEKPPFEIWMFTVYRPGLEDWDFAPQDQSMHPCTYNKRNISVRGNGELTPCTRMIHPLGNVKRGTLSDEMKSAPFKNFWSLAIRDIAECQDCRYLRACGSGCRAHAMQEFGTVLKNDPMACTIMPLYEKYLVPLFSMETRASFEVLLNKSGRYPTASCGAQNEGATSINASAAENQHPTNVWLAQRAKG